ncbi:hypothetical protein MMC17_005553 [Xylographa soralifera]|nr:hypothetical protein [Xylographa soralifera]
MLAKAVADDAFKDYGTWKELLKTEPIYEEMRRIQFNEDVFDKPFLATSSSKISNPNTVGEHLKNLGFRTGLVQPLLFITPELRKLISSLRWALFNDLKDELWRIPG